MESITLYLFFDKSLKMKLLNVSAKINIPSKKEAYFNSGLYVTNIEPIFKLLDLVA